MHATEAELGDAIEEYSRGGRSPLWLAHQLLSMVRAGRPRLRERKERVEMLSNIARDIRYAIRTLARNPGFAAAAIAPIALGIGINTGLFSILNSVALRPLPTPESHHLVTVYQQFQGVKQRRVHGARSLFSLPEYYVYRDNARTLSGVMAYSLPRSVTLGGDAPQELEGVMVTCNYFDVLQVRPSIGAGFTPATCDRAGAAAGVVLTHRLWTRAFGADRAIVEKTIALNGQQIAVAGVAPEDFDGIDFMKADLFVPTSLQQVIFPQQDFQYDADTSWLTIVGRRQPGADIAQVRAELALIAGEIDRQQPPRTTTLSIEPATALSLPPARSDILTVAAIVLAAFGLVLLIACANVANLMLARAADRTREIAVRLSVGASRARLVQQLMTESLTIALAGGVAGSLLAWWSFQTLLTWLLSSLPGTIPALRADAQPDTTVLWFALALTAITAVAFGLVPALQASKPDLQSVMKQEGAQTSGRTGWMRGMLIGAQAAVCMVLLICAGLLVRALYAAQTLDPGFEYADVAAVEIELRDPSYREAKLVGFRQQLTERIQSLPGVAAVARVSKLPMSPGRHQTMFRLPDREQRHEADVNGVSSSYFSIVGIPIVRGRPFGDADSGEVARSVIVTEATARRYWPGEDPIGRRIMMSTGPGGEIPLEIVGVAKDAQMSPDAQVGSSYLYLPAGSRGQRRLGLVIRGGGEFGGLASSIRGVARELDPALVVRVSRLEENLEFWRTGSRMMAGLSGSLSLLALVLASLGVYGVVSCVVSRRRREVGIRMTLGASSRSVQRLILRQTLRPVVVGVAAGIAAAAAASRMLESVLFGISPLDPVAFIGAPLFLLAVAAAATLIPTRAALKVDPMTALRYE